ncbi:MAG: hypothetical protein V4754_04365 [Pseudomonadota bacterium]
MPTWMYENGCLVAKNALGTVIFQREMDERQARRMAQMVNLPPQPGEQGAGAAPPDGADKV